MKTFQAFIFTLISYFSAFAQSGEKLGNVDIQPPKYAIVIGINNYKFLTPLKNSLNDAEDMKNVLAGWGYKVKKLTNADLVTLSDSLLAFISQIPKNAIVIFYFSGHGIGYNGKNYLLVKNSNIQCIEDIEFQGFALDRILLDIEKRQPLLKLAFMDACRSIPNLHSCIDNTKSISNSGPVRPSNLTKGTFIAFATQEGKTALEVNIDRNSLFTNELLKYLIKPNLSLRTILDSTTIAVDKRSQTKQIPNRYDELRGDFWFSKNIKVVAPDINNIESTNTINKKTSPKSRCNNTDTHLYVESMGRALTQETSKKIANINAKSEIQNAFTQQIENSTENYVRVEMDKIGSEEQQTFKETIKETKISNLIGFLTENAEYKNEKNETGQKVIICSICAKAPFESNLDLMIDNLKKSGKLSGDFDYEKYKSHILKEYKNSIK